MLDVGRNKYKILLIHNFKHKIDCSGKIKSKISFGKNDHHNTNVICTNPLPFKLLFVFCRSGAFSHLRFVTTLALSHCDIETLEDGAFEGMEALTEVKLETNKLQYIQGTGLFPKNLNHIEVSESIFKENTENNGVE